MVDLAGPPLLDSVTPETANWMLSLARRKSYNDGEFIHSRGDEDPTMEVVIEGEMRLVRLRPDGTQSLVTVVRPGQHIADMLLLGNYRRSHTAIAIGSTVVDHYDRKAFNLLLQNHDVLHALYRLSCYRLAMAITTADDLRSLSRVAHLGKLLYAVTARKGCNDWVEIVQEDLASFLGVSTMTVAKALTRLKNEGLIETGYRKIRVPDRAQLKAWVDREQAD